MNEKEQEEKEEKEKEAAKQEREHKEREARARKALEEKKGDDEEEQISFWRRADLPSGAPSCFTSPLLMGFTSSIMIRFLLDCMGVRWGLDGHAASKSQ